MRKLAYAAGGYAAAIFLAHYVLPARLLPYAAGIMALFALPAFLLPRGVRMRVMLAAVSAAVGFGWYFCAAHLRLEPVQAVSNDERTVTARVTAYPQEYEHSVGITVRLTDPVLPHLTARLYDYAGESAELRPGDEITVRVKLRPATERYGEETDTYLSRGIYFLGTIQEAPEKTGVWPYRVLYFPKTIAYALKTSAARVFPEDAVPFAQALMLGDKQALYAQNLDIPLRNAGIMHTVAVSGMHLTYLLGFVRLLFGRRKLSAALALPLMAVFAVMAGASASIMRAAFMAALLLFAPILGRENDPPTSLLTALALLLACNPFSAGSVALQLSFASMGGIFLLSGPIYRFLSARFLPPKWKLRKFTRAAVQFILATTATSVGSMAFTVPLSALHFGSVSLVAPLTNLLVLWMLPVCFVGGYLAAAAGLVWPLAGQVLAWAVAWPLRYVLGAAELLSRLPGAALSAKNPLVVLWLVFVYVLFAVTYRLSERGKYRPVLPVCCCVCTLCAVVLLTAWSTASVPCVTALDVGQGQSIAFLAGNDTVLVDCGGNGAVTNAGDTAAQYLRSVGRSTVDVLVLTHSHEDHTNGVLRLLQQVRVRMLVVPEAADSESEPLRGILKLAEQKNVEILRLSEDTQLELQHITLAVYARLGRTHEDGCLMLRASVGEFDTLITGDVKTEVEAQLALAYDLSGTELLVAGHHGSRYSTGETLLDATGAQRAIVSCGYNAYGHPTEETLERLQNHGIEIYRTDQLGSVTVRLN